MDLKKLKGMNWVGNIYQKFEAICQEVDDIVNQDTIKYVETQVQTVGKSVKKLCSDVVQDLIPPLGNPVNHDTQEVAITYNSTISTKSREHLEENSSDEIEKQSPAEPNVMDPVINQPSLVSSKYFLADQPSSPTSMDSSEVSESDVSVGKIREVFSNENSLGATEMKSPSEPHVMDPVTNQLSTMSCKYQLADQPSSPTSLDTLELSEYDLSVEKIDEVLTNEKSLDATEESPTECNVMDPVTNQPSLGSSKFYLADQPYSPTSMDTLVLSEAYFSVENQESLDATENQSPTEPNVMDPVTNQPSLISCKCHIADQQSAPISMDTLEVSESDFSARKIDEVLTNGISLDATKNQSPTEPSIMDHVASQLRLVSSKYHLADQLSSPTSINTLGVSESDLSVGKIDDNLTNENSDANNEEISIKMLDLTSPVMSEHFTESPFQVFAHSNYENRHTFLPEVAPISPAHGLEFESQQKCTVCSDEILSVSGASNTTTKMVFSDVSGEDTPLGIAPFSSCNAKESLRLFEYSPENLSLEAMFSHNYVEETGCVSDVSNEIPTSASPLTVSGKIKDVDMGLSSFRGVLSLEPVEEGTSRITLTLPPTVPSGKQQVQICESVQFDALNSFSDIGLSDESSCDFSHSSMETIDLHDKVKLEESCVIVDDSVLHAISFRTRKLRSYKKRIQDAFTSKKRLTKEYEQLAIWFGDTDINSSQETLSNMTNLQTHDACDSEWELL
ncbi:hypothetical protein PRUPE_4G170200 [Prunus persica]|uniref:Uncharacterized protein n=1 Tax=Prunus persica TaxID=3760 RepID=A0A251PLV3_PRUPE|nr:uncharacterized protein LOC18778424 [Prunus persica]XP_020417690.1 uncharacterized protein LOC18778424 [Prunus persica]ONI12536.1 hypothetical protein PRUPE_4G170200 [Prunus persica]ONI12537.1 hypothetical protein PRUPE_4G170200 [Prunus persica]